MTDCPPDDTLEEYLNDSLPPDRAGPVTRHIDDCAACQQRLDDLTSESGRLADRMKVMQPTLPALPGAAAASPHPLTAARQVLPVVPGYTLQEELGRGGMGVVYKAVHKRLNRPAAVKMVLAGGLADPRVTQRFLFEAEVLGRVVHPQVVQVYEVSMYAAPTGVTIPFLAMEYLDGGTLADWSDGRPHPPKVAAALVEGLGRAVQAAHAQGVIHRDLKPANILRGSDGTFKVTDFGLAKLTADTSGGLTGTGTVVGTPAYMAPEQASGEKGIGPPADVYSLGAILFELLTGRPPFDGAEPMSVLLKVIRDQPPDVRAVRPEVPRDLAAVVARCLTKEPHRRYASAAELADDLKRFCDGRPTRARAHGAAERVWYWSRRNPGVAALLGAMLLVVVTAFGSVMVLWRRAETDAAALGQAFAAARRQSAEAERQRDEAARQRRAADRQGAYLAFDQAVHWCENGQLDDGLRGFVRALDLAERIGERELTRVIRINIAAWERVLFPAGQLFRTGDLRVLSAYGFSPDGRWVFAAGRDRVRIWDADTGDGVAELTDAAHTHITTLIKRLPLPDGLLNPPGIRAVAVNWDRTRVAATLSSGVVAVWDLKGPRPVNTLRPVANGRPSADIWAAEFDRNGHLWVGGDAGLLVQFDVTTGRRLRTLSVPLAGEDVTSVQTLRLSASGTTLYTGDRAGRLLAWDLATGEATVAHQLGGWVSDIGLPQQGEGVAVCGTNGAAVVGHPFESRWDLPTNGAYASGIRFANRDRYVILADRDGSAQLWDSASRAMVGGPLRLGMDARRVVPRPDRPELLVPTDGGVRLQPLAGPASVSIPRDWLHLRVRVLAFSSDEKQLLVGAGPLRIIDAETGELVRYVPTPEEALGGRFLDGGRKVLFTLRTGWGVCDAAATEPPLTTPSNHYVSLLAADPTGADVRLFLSGQFYPLRDDGSVGRAGSLPSGIDFQATHPSDACVAPGGRELRFALLDSIRFHDLTSGEEARAPIRAADEVRSLAQTNDGSALVAGLRNNDVQVWDRITGTARFAPPPRHEFAVTSVVFSPDGRVILSGSRDRTARFWDSETGLVLGPRLRHADAVTLVTYSPSGRRVATGTSAGRAAVWQAPPDPVADPVEVLRRRYDRLKGNAFPESAEWK